MNILFSPLKLQIFLKSIQRSQNVQSTIKSRAVDRSTTVLNSLGQMSQYISININTLKMLGCATNQDSLLLVTLRYLIVRNE